MDVIRHNLAQLHAIVADISKIEKYHGELNIEFETIKKAYDTADNDYKRHQSTFNSW